MRRAREPQAVLTRARMRALVRPDPAGTVVLDAHAREQPVARAAAPVGPGVVLLERPQGGLAVLDDDSLLAPLPQQRGRVRVRVAAAGILREVDLDDVVRGAGDQLGALGGVDDVVGRRGDGGQAPCALEVVVEGVQRRDVGHGGGGC